MTTPHITIAQHFDGRAKDVLATFDRIMAIAREWGDIKTEAKKTAIHLMKTETAFAVIGTRKDYLILTVKVENDIRSPRVVKHEQTASGKWQIDIKLTNAKEVDHELQQWMRASYLLAK